MINSIYIKNFVIIDELRLELTEGLNIFIGETGAGKSIIMNAIDLLSGKRGDTSFIQKGKDKAILEASFTLDERYRQRLEEYEIDYDDELIVYRLLSPNKNVIRINNQSVTLNILKAIFNDAIDIHSQNDTQYLFKPKNQLAILDRIKDHKELLKEVRKLYEIKSTLEKKYNDLKAREDSKDDLEYYEYQLKELEEADFKEKEEEELENFLRRYRSLEKIFSHLNRAIELYESPEGISEKIYELIKELDLDDEEVAKINAKINDNYAFLDENIKDLKKIVASLDLSPNAINEANERLSLIKRLKRKYHRDIKEMIDYIDELRQRLDENKHRGERLVELETKIANAREEYLSKAKELSLKRKESAKDLEMEVLRSIEGLELKYFDFKVDFKEVPASAFGIDEVNFMICTNKGQDMTPLNKSASGGEMSRILLAIKAVLNDLMKLDLVIFDEIDTGVSGKAALAMGEKMLRIANNSQVLAITHLAQVAAFGDEVYYVYKDDEKEKTTSHIKALEKDDIAKELALMATGSQNDNALNSAYDLLNKAKEIKDAYK